MSDLKSNKEIKALVSLLDDTDQEVFTEIERKLLSFGKDVIPVLEDVWSHSFDTLIQSRIEHIIHKIQFEALCIELQLWSSHRFNDLLAGAILIARLQYPDLNEDKIRQQLSQLKRDIWIELNEHLTALEQINIFNRILFDVHGFSGNTANFHAPQNSFINTVLETKKGNPLLLSIIYSIIANELDIPVQGVNLPEHFILCYQDPVASEHYDYTYPKANVLFYINPFSKGTIFSKGEIDQFLKKLKMDPNPIFYEPCNNHEILKRLLRNLSFSYNKIGDLEKADEVQTLLDILEKN
ncbi:MAG: transglutaminase family protein [Bacteroidetes bacterium]|nr:transglutaminase family protein [Bacteroidota bacterium]